MTTADHPWTKGEELTPHQRDVWEIMLREQKRLGRTLTSLELGDRFGFHKTRARQVMQKLATLGYAVQVVESGRTRVGWAIQAVADRLDRRDIAIRPVEPKQPRPSKPEKPAAVVRRSTEEEKAVAWGNRGLALSYADRVRKPWEDRGEIVQAAYLGLIKGVRRFDPGRGTKLSTCVEFSMKFEVARYRRSRNFISTPGYLWSGKGKSNPLAVSAKAAAGIKPKSLRFGFATSDDRSIARIDDEDEIEALRRSIGKLPDRLGRLIALRLDGATLKESGKEIDVTPERARQLEKEAVELLREMMCNRKTA